MCILYVGELLLRKQGALSVILVESCWVAVELIPKEYCGLRLEFMFTLTKQSDGSQLKIARDILYDCISDDRQTRDMFDVLAPDMSQEPEDETGDEIFENLKLIEYDERQ